MRLWSIHPKYLDAKGIVALWREGLLAQKVLMGKTKGYRNHPQLIRFKEQKDPVRAISAYLSCVWQESVQRGYSFDKNKIHTIILNKKALIKVTNAQVKYEYEHLGRKLKVRDPKQYKSNRLVKRVIAHPLFRVVRGDVEDWEII